MIEGSCARSALSERNPVNGGPSAEERWADPRAFRAGGAHGSASIPPPLRQKCLCKMRRNFGFRSCRMSIDEVDFRQLSRYAGGNVRNVRVATFRPPVEKSRRAGEAVHAR